MRNREFVFHSIAPQVELPTIVWLDVVDMSCGRSFYCSSHYKLALDYESQAHCLVVLTFSKKKKFLLHDELGRKYFVSIIISSC